MTEVSNGIWQSAQWEAMVVVAETAAVAIQVAAYVGERVVAMVERVASAGRAALAGEVRTVESSHCKRLHEASSC